MSFAVRDNVSLPTGRQARCSRQGDSVQTRPDSLLWARGFRFGEVLEVNAKRSEVLVHFDSGARLWVACAAVLEV